MIDVGAFRALNEYERRYLTGGEWRGSKWRISGAPKKPYFLPFQDVVIQGVQAVKRPGWKAHFYFDENKSLASFALQLYTIIKRGSDSEFASRMGEMTFASGRERAGLQAADLFTYAWYQYRLRGRSARPEVLAVMDTLTRRGDELHYFSAQTMDKLLGKAPLTDGKTYVV